MPGDVASLLKMYQDEEEDIYEEDEMLEENESDDNEADEIDDDDEFYVRVKKASMAVMALVTELRNGCIERPLARRPISRSGYTYIHNELIGKYFLVDASYPNRHQFLAPFRGERYHLQQFGLGRDLERAEELFNLRHASLRNVIKKLFGVFKSRFSIFKLAPPFPYKTQADIVLVVQLYITLFVKSIIQMSFQKI
ncbi:hypothetical protein QJS10_CPB12g00606 [Acorus calamus]|uniref:DDE Tnp4 domain-containing protein n=1 Tax=Acorus calamus TaxID=4465 RepID=A0AAV9DMQ7_ACOCL|nr:hypothetical protein QJS10_CPB12g00606 [Acorus calamus]